MDFPPPTPPPLPSTPPPPLPPGAVGVVWRSQEQTDREHLRLLMIFHFVFAGLGFIWLGFLVFYYFMFTRLFSDPNFLRTRTGEPAQPLPPEFLMIFGWVLVGFGVLIVLKMALDVISGWCILRRRGRMLSLILGGLNCIFIPFGTVLGIFTFMILQRPSVQRLYGERSFSAGPTGPTV